MHGVSRLGSKSRWVLAVVLLGVLGAGAIPAYYFVFGPRDEAKQKPLNSPGDRLTWMDSFGRPRSSARPHTVAALGKLRPRGETIDLGGLMGDRLGQLLVEEGDRVTQDQVLGYLDSHGERLAEKNAIEAQLAEAEARLVAEEDYWNAQIEEANLALRQARELDPLDIDALRARIDAITAERDAAQAQLTRLESLSPGSVTSANLDQAKQLLRRADQELTAAQCALNKALAGQKLNLERAEVLLRKARSGLTQAKAAVPLRSLRGSLAVAVARLKRTVIRAPRDGCILKVFARPGEKLDAQPILRLGDTAVMYAVAEVYETDALLVKEGQLATATSPALDKPLTGRVERIGQLIFKNDVLHIDPAADADARVVEAWIRLDPSEAASRLTNLQVDVTINLAKD